MAAGYVILSARQGRRLMRLGLLAAAAAMVLPVGQASAARYYEFQVTGSANTGTLLSPNGTYALNYTSTDTYWFDTASWSNPGPFAYLMDPVSTGGTAYNAGTGFEIVLAPNAQRSAASISILDQPGGPSYSLSFNLGDIPAGDTLQALPLAGTPFVYRVRADPRYGTTYDTGPGQIVSVLARTTDITPTIPQATEQLAISAVPEPAAWAMMIAGLGVIGAVLRRRRSTARRAAALAA